MVNASIIPVPVPGCPERPGGLSLLGRGNLAAFHPADGRNDNCRYPAGYYYRRAVNTGSNHPIIFVKLLFLRRTGNPRGFKFDRHPFLMYSRRRPDGSKSMPPLRVPGADGEERVISMGSNRPLKISDWIMTMDATSGNNRGEEWA